MVRRIVRHGLDYGWRDKSGKSGDGKEREDSPNSRGSSESQRPKRKYGAMKYNPPNSSVTKRNDLESLKPPALRPGSTARMGLAMGSSLRTWSTKPSEPYDCERMPERDFSRCRFHGAGIVGCIRMHHCPPWRMSCGAADAPQDSLGGGFIGRGWTL